VFVMWDGYIRGEKKRAYYEALPCVAAGKWGLSKYDKSGAGYVRFLSEIQNRFRNLSYPPGPRTLAKAIDEWHYVNVTLPIQAMENASAKR